jgi:DNA polymerase-3 subunit delta'
MNWDIVGHTWAVELLQGQLARGQMHHAYLLTGPQGVGRRTLALRLAQALNCLEPPAPGMPCGTCRACRLIAQMQHPDLSVVQAEAVGGTLKVDQVRELQRSLALAPYEARYRVALLLRFEEAHLSAANALLKTLEEPPPNVILILTASSAEGLLETIVSRCEVLRLRPLPLSLVESGLQARWSLDQDEARLLAHISNGRLGYAVFLHDDGDFLEKRQDWLDELFRLLQADLVERFHFADQAAKDRSTLRELLTVWLSYWRDVLLDAAGTGVPLTNIDREAEIHQLAAHLALADVYNLIISVEDKLEAINSNANLRLVLENLLLDLPRLALASDIL